jgi:hypothetical protein
MPYVLVYGVSATLSGAWLWAVAKWTGLEFPLLDLVITVCFSSGFALLPGYGWLLGMIVLWLLLKGVRQADLWPDIILMAGGSAFIWLAAGLTASMLIA